MDFQRPQVIYSCRVLDSELALGEQSLHGIDHYRHYMAVALDRRIVQSPREQRFTGWARELVRHLPEDEHAPGTIGDGVNLHERAILPAGPAVCHIGRGPGYRQPGAAKSNCHLISESIPGSERAGIGCLRHLHGSQVSVMPPRSFRYSITVTPGGLRHPWDEAGGRVTVAPTCQAAACGSFRTVIVGCHRFDSDRRLH